MAKPVVKQKVGRPCYCPGCLTILPLRIDKNGNPYFRCQICALTIFMGTSFAQVQFLMLQSMIAKNPARWKLMIARGVSAKTRTDFADKMREARHPTIA